MKGLFCAFFAVLLLFAAPGWATVPASGVTYPAKTTIEAPQLQTSFVIPNGWSGMLSPDQSSFMLTQPGAQSSVVVAADRMDKAQATAYLSQAYPLGGRITLVPSGAPTVKKNRLRADYTLASAFGQEGAGEFGARARATVLSNGVTVVAVAIGPATELPKLDKTLEAVLASVKTIKAPKAVAANTAGKPAAAKPAAAKPADGKQAAASPPSGQLAAALSNKRLNRFHHGSGYSERQMVTLCADGRFLFNMNATSASQLGSGVYNSANAGRWSATGSSSGGTVTLRFNDGRVSTHSVQFVQGKLMVDGTRWLREPQQCP